MCAVAALHRERSMTNLNRIAGRDSIERATGRAQNRQCYAAIDSACEIALQRKPVLMRRIIRLVRRIEREPGGKHEPAGSAAWRDDRDFETLAGRARIEP